MRVNDRVTRRKVNAFRYRQGLNGTVVQVFPVNPVTIEERCYIKWDKKADTGQQHSTIQTKFLLRLETCVRCNGVGAVYKPGSAFKEQCPECKGKKEIPEIPGDCTNFVKMDAQ